MSKRKLLDQLNKSQLITIGDKYDIPLTRYMTKIGMISRMIHLPKVIVEEEVNARIANV